MNQNNTQDIAGQIEHVEEEYRLYRLKEAIYVALDSSMFGSIELLARDAYDLRSQIERHQQTTNKEIRT